MLTNARFPIYFLILLFVAKLFATCLTLGSGASGGVFSRALFWGATAGGAYAVVLHHLFPGPDIPAPAFAIVGMGGVVGGATGAALAAIVMMFEMTLDYTLIIPMTLTVAISYAVRKSVIRDSIYARKLALLGDPVPESLRADLQQIRLATGVMDSHVEVVPAATRFQDLASHKNEAFVITDATGIVEGVVAEETLAALGAANPTAVIGDAFHHKYVVVSSNDSVWKVVAAMRAADSAFALVVSNADHLSAGSVQGLITRKAIMDVLADDIEAFGV